MDQKRIVMSISEPSKRPTVSYHESDQLKDLTEAVDSVSSQERAFFFSEQLPIEIDDYRIETEIARGGMGVILRGRDTRFDRSLAFKTLLDNYQAHPQIVHRFQNEAQISGRLQHPGVPPVYAEGQFPSGRPYFSMKLIEGRTFAEILRGRESLEDFSSDLVIFEQICQTVAYAHSLQIIHRDLKPHNVMVGAYGEVQVMDWGLAKDLSSVEPVSTEESNVPATAVLEDRTRIGSIIGTPAYLSPEQAQGNVHSLDQRSDVYGLGAILCEILTGKPPHVDDSAQQVRQEVLHGNLEDAIDRLEESNADKELVALTRSCLAFDPDERPQSAQELADAIAHYRQGAARRLQQAKIESAESKVQAREERKRRKLTLALFVVLLLMVTAGAGFGLWWQDQQASEREKKALLQQRQSRQALVVLEKLKTLIEQKKFDEARDRATRALAELKNASEPLRQQLSQALQEIDLAERLYNLRFLHSHVVKAMGERSTAEATYRSIFKKANLDLLAGDANLKAIAQRIQKSSLRDHWITALDDWAQSADELPIHERILKVARLADDDSTHNHFRDPQLLSDSQKLLNELNKTKAEKLTPSMWGVLCLRLQSRKINNQALLRKAQNAYPNDFWLNYLLANSLYGSSVAEAIGFYRAALALRPDSFGVMLNLGSLLIQSKKYDEALQIYRQAEKLEPRNPALLHNLGNCLLKMNLPKDAIRHLESALQIKPKSVMTLTELGLAWFREKDFEKTIDYSNRALKLNPKSSRARMNLVLVYYARQKDQKVIDLSLEILKDDPGNTRAHLSLAEAYQKTSQLKNAISVYHALARIDPGQPRLYRGIASVYSRLQKYDLIVQWLRKGVMAVPRSAQLYRLLGLSLIYEKGDFDQGLLALQQGLSLTPPVTALHREILGRIDHAKSRREIESRLQLLLKGKLKNATEKEKLMLARHAFHYGHRFYLSASIAKPIIEKNADLVQDPTTGNRDFAARALIRSANGDGPDARLLTAMERTEWRQLGLKWLQAELALWKKRGGLRASTAIRAWMTIPAFESVREPSALQKLPEKERKAWEQFWNDVRKLVIE